MSSRPLLFCLLLAGAALAAAAPHRHGEARLDIAIDGRRIELAFEVPLNDLLGYERAPRSDAERSHADALVARLRDAGKLLRIDPAAACDAAEVTIDAPVLGLGGTAALESRDGHADLRARYVYACRDGTRAGFLTHGLFDAAPALRQIEVRLASPRGQSKAVVKRPSSRVVLAR